MPSSKIIQNILEIAKWAPSGDNCQPWNFEVLSRTDFLIHITFNTENVYEYKNGQPTLIALGCLIENISLAASLYNYKATLKAINARVGNQQTFEICLEKDKSIHPNELAGFITERSVHRGAYKVSEIPDDMKAQLENCLPEGVEIKWYPDIKDKIKFVRMYMLATDIRLSIPETYKIHKEMLDWKNRFSPTGIPVRATGLSSITIGLMGHVMKSYKYLNFMNRFMWGTLLPRIEMDMIPGIFCASHFTFNVTNSNGLMTVENLIDLGRYLQRFWLSLTKFGLVMQPEFAPVIFGTYGDKGINFTGDKNCLRKAQKLAFLVRKYAHNEEIDRLVFVGRIGRPRAKNRDKPRSVRLSLKQLMLNG